MIIIEGMDHSGKTRLARSLSSILGISLHHSPSHLIEERKIDEWLMWIEWTLVGDAEPTVLDRHPIISETIYGPVLRDLNLLSTTDYFDRLLKSKPFIIHCRPSVKRLMTNPKDEMEGVKENFKELLNRYDNLFYRMAQQRFNIMHYDYTKTSMKMVVNRALRHLQKVPPLVMIKGGKA